MKWFIYLFLFLCVLSLSDACAQSDENILVGSRPLALGGAFTAVADDANAMFYNPAGLQNLRQHEITFMNAELFGTGIRTTYLAYALPITRRQAVGIDWQHIGFGDGELGYNRDIIKVAYSHRIFPRLSLGGTFKYLLTNMSLDGQSVGKGTGIGGDFGILVSLRPNLKIGVGVHDVSKTGVTYTDGGSATLLPRAVRVGLAWEPQPNLLLALDIDRKLHVGSEFRLNEWLALRGGIQKDLKTSDSFEFTLGLGLNHRAFQIDGAHTPERRGLGQTQRYGMTVSFDPASSPVRIVRVEGDDLFASYYKTYDGQSMGQVILENRTDQSVECRLIVSAPGYETAPYEELFIVRKGDRTQTVPLKLLLSEDLLNVTKDTAIPLQIQVVYSGETRTRADKHNSKMVIYGRGALLWDDIGRAAAFVTSRDSEVESFARHVSHQISNTQRIRQMDRNIVQAGVVFEALRQYGIAYQLDPNNPFTDVISAEWPFDHIQYPRELLRTRTGDCDDCTVLYCSLLENLGIATAVVDVPGHIFAIFDTGITPSAIYRLGIKKDRFIEWDGRLWAPVETTLWDKSFEEVWAAGLQQLRALPDLETRIRKVSEAWKTYPPAEPPFEFEIDEATIQRACDSAVVANQVEIINRFKRAFINDEYSRVLLDRPNDPELHFELAYVYLALNLLEDARSAVQKAANFTDEGARVETFQGNIAFVGGDWPRAVNHYQRAVQIDPDDPGLQANLDRAMQKMIENNDPSNP